MHVHRLVFALAASAIVIIAIACGGTTNDVAASSSGSNDGGPTTTADNDASTDTTSPAVVEDAAVSSDARVGRPLGELVNVVDAPCGDAGAPPPATCKRATVRCNGLPDIAVTIATVVPAAPSVPTATIVGFSGGGGDDGFYTAGVVRLYQEAKYRLVLVKWDSDWEQTPTGGILEGACRPATVVQYAFEVLHGSKRTEAFCGAGFSGGSGQLSYALAHYGRKDVLDYVSLAAGPPFGRIDYGCAPSTYSGPARALCPLLPNAVLPLPPVWLNAWENTKTCMSPTPDPIEIAKWKKDSVVSEGADYDYPKSVVEFFDCTNQPNGTTGGAYFYSQAITSTKQVFCFDGPNDGCQGEGLGTGVSTLVTEMIAKCVPRH